MMLPVPRRGLRFLWLALDLGVSPAAFYLTQAAGFGVVRALITAATVATCWLAVGTLRTRRLDAVALTMIVTYALMLAMALATHDPRLVLLRDPAISAITGLIFLASTRTAVPVTAYLAQRLHGAETLSPGEIRTHRQRSALWGAVLTAESAVRAALVFALPIPVVAGISPLLELVVLAALGGYAYRQHRRHRNPVAEMAEPVPAR
ncbi:hypothetical protein LTV02_03095 [Nocardia yamanashiensis]|uniref:VC0807 family protein n=1 Tax=Nocardia yamanashiensis TaxID=209247 RepID=UPI001E32FF03|nr:VC0807 family protein [Nocardia yamanashiensis]UGT42422.1 hypothetical protein LTV02_03095 [Nocardia yamanashiensis]